MKKAQIMNIFNNGSIFITFFFSPKIVYKIYRVSQWKVYNHDFRHTKNISRNSLVYIFLFSNTVNLIINNFPSAKRSIIVWKCFYWNTIFFLIIFTFLSKLIFYCLSNSWTGWNKNIFNKKYLNLFPGNHFVYNWFYTK